MKWAAMARIKKSNGAVGKVRAPVMSMSPRFGLWRFWHGTSLKRGFKRTRCGDGGSEKLCGPSENPGDAELSAANESKYTNLALILHSIAIPREFESGLLGIGRN